MNVFGRSIEWENLAALPWVLIVLALLLVAMAWSYRLQAQTLQPAIGWLLRILRCGAIVVLALSVLKPVLVMTASQAQRGAVVFVVDASASMAVKDDRPPAERVALARAIGALPVVTVDANLEAVRLGLQDVRNAIEALTVAEEEVRLANASGREDSKAGERVSIAVGLLSDALSELSQSTGSISAANVARAVRNIGTDAAIDRNDLRRRIEAAGRELAHATASADGAQYRSENEVRMIADATAESSRSRLAMLAARRIMSGLPADVPVYAFAAGESQFTIDLKHAVEPTASFTDSRGAIASAAASIGNVPVRGIVLLSDGRQVTDGSTAASARNDVPVFAVNVAPAGRSKDVAVSIIAAPQRVSPGESAVVRVAVRSQGGAAVAPTNVVLSYPSTSGKSQMTKPVEIDREGNGEVEFNVKLDVPGLNELQATVAPIADEISTANNTAKRRVRVVSGKVRVAAYAGSPAWDFQYLRNALQRSAPWAELREGVLSVAATTSPSFPLTAAEILDQDVIVLCDVDVSSLSSAQWDAVYQLVTGRGGSVIVLANDERVLNSYAQQSQATALLPLRAGLRYTWRTWSGERPTLRVSPVPDSILSHTGLLRLGTDTDTADVTTIARLWQERPALFRVMPLSGLKPTVEPVLQETDSQTPVLTEQRLGRGRSIFVGINETWRWRMNGGDRIHDQFLLQLVRYAADEPYAAKDGDVSLDVDAVVARPDTSVSVRARLQSTNATTLPTTLTVTVKRDDGDASRLVLTADDNGAIGRYRAPLTDLQPGRYEVTLDAEKVEGITTAPSRISVPFVVESDISAERLDVTPDADFLRQLATVSGGRALSLNEIDTLPAALLSAGDPRYEQVRRPLWDGPLLYCLVVAMLTTEWALRKRFGLA